MISDIDLKEGEDICSKCEGKGALSSQYDPHDLARICPKCGGSGKVDWITNVMGEKKPKPLYVSSAFSTSYNYCGSTSGYGLPVVKTPPVTVVGSMYVDENTKAINIYTGSKWEEVDNS